MYMLVMIFYSSLKESVFKKTCNKHREIVFTTLKNTELHNEKCLIILAYRLQIHGSTTKVYITIKIASEYCNRQMLLVTTNGYWHETHSGARLTGQSRARDSQSCADVKFAPPTSSTNRITGSLSGDGVLKSLSKRLEACSGVAFCPVSSCRQ